jgi:hypothetical protein
MTNVDVLFRYEQQPSEAAMFALGNLKEVYGIRRIEINQPGKTIRVEYDATRLTGQLWRICCAAAVSASSKRSPS